MAADRVLVVGALHWDRVVRAPRLPRRDETLVGSGIEEVFGGKGGNQAVAAALHGASVAMAGRVGDDPAAVQLLGFLDRAGVARGQVQQGKGPSGTSVAIVDEKGDYGAVIVSAANLEIDAQAIAVPPETALVLLQNEVPEAVNLAVARAARAAGAKLLLNAAPVRPTSEELLSLVDLLIVNRTEAAMLAGQEIADRAAASAVAARLARDGRGALVTLGAEGLVYSGPEGEIARPAFAVEVVSTHGAGDAFVGALAARLAAPKTAGGAFAPALDYAQAAAALGLSRPPGERLSITPAAVERLLQSTRR